MSRRRTLPAWFAILAMALQALWPLVAQAKPFDPLQSAAICSAAGAPAGGDVPHGGDPASAHCGLCVSGAGKPALPPAPPGALLEIDDVPLAGIAHRSRAILSPPPYPPASPRAPPQALL